MALTNEQLLKKFEQDMRLSLEGLSDSTIKFHMRYVGKFLAAVNKPAFDITKNEINAYVLGLKKQNGEDMNIDAKQNYLSSIKRFYNFLFEDSDDRDIILMRVFYDENGREHQIVNPVSSLKAVNTSPAAKLLKNERKEGLTIDDARKLLNHLQEHCEYADKNLNANRRFVAHRDYCMILLMLETGLRYSDVSELSITKSLLNDMRELQVVVKKTKKKLKFYLSDVLREGLEKYLALHKKRSQYLFCTQNGDKMLNYTTNLMLKEHKTKAGIDKEVTCHTLRHTCGALVYAETKDLAFVKELLGHGSVTTTQRYVYSEDVMKNMKQTTTKVTEQLVGLA